MKGINVLPDDVLLDIFDFNADMSLSSYGGRRGIEAWQSLVHVCQRWRSLVFESPPRLNLRLYCAPETPTKDALDVWPALPLTVWGRMTVSGTESIIAALNQSNRVCEISLFDIAAWKLEQVLAATQVPFPELTRLQLWPYTSCLYETPLVIPDSFLGGSAPRLRNFTLFGIPFPGLSKLVLSATHLVVLNLFLIPHSGYISPEAMVALLSMLASLKTLSLGFKSLQSRPDWESQCLPPPKRSILPALDRFDFNGVTEYLEDLVTRIDAPQLHSFGVDFFNQIDFDCARLSQFFNRTPTLSSRAYRACVRFDDQRISVSLRTRSWSYEIAISWREPHRQLSSVAQVFNSYLHPLSTIRVLYIVHRYRKQVWKIDAIEARMEGTLWLQLLLPFSAMTRLHLSKEFAPGITAAVQGPIRGEITKVFPSLQNIFVEGSEPLGPVQENNEGQFVAVRLHPDHSSAISYCDEDPRI